MKRIVFLFALLLATTTIVHAQSKEEKKVAEVVDAFNQAMIHPTTAVFSDMVSSGLSYGHSAGLVQNRAEFLDDIVNGTFRFLTPKVENQTIEIVGDNAIVRHVFTSKITNKGVEGELRIGNLQVWVKEKGTWKLLARQAFKI